jgi:Protein of unknown function (DUF1236)
MRSKLLISTAALLAGVAWASAQNMPSGGQSGGAQGGGAMQHQGGGASGQSVQDKQSQQGKQGQQGKQSQQTQPGQQGQRSQKDQTTGQAAQGQRDQGQRDQGQRDQGASGKDLQKDQGRTQRDQRGKETTGQGQQGQTGQMPNQRSGQIQRDQRDQTQGQAPQRQQQGQTPQQTQQGQVGQGGGQAGGSVNLSTEQRTRIRETVLAGGNAPRVSNVNFALSVGTTVPTSVRVVEVPSVLIEIRPDWRGYMYFVVGDEIVIVDRNHRIVAVLPV